MSHILTDFPKFFKRSIIFSMINYPAMLPGSDRPNVYWSSMCLKYVSIHYHKDFNTSNQFLSFLFPISVIGYGHPVCFDLTTSGSQLLNHLHKYLKKFMVFLYKIINIIFSLLYFTPLQAKTVVKYITITFTCESVYKLLT